MEFTKLPEDYEVGHAEYELNALGHSLEEPLWLFWEEIGESLSDDAKGNEIILDWAFQIRIAEPNLSHASALLAAKVFYYG